VSHHGVEVERNRSEVTFSKLDGLKGKKTKHAVSVDQTRDLQIFSLTL
jgi:hypothetical protein